VSDFEWQITEQNYNL